MRALKIALGAAVVGAAALVSLPEPALSQGGGCNISSDVCKVIEGEICIPPTPCYPTTFVFPGKPTDE